MAAAGCYLHDAHDSSKVQLGLSRMGISRMPNNSICV